MYFMKHCCKNKRRIENNKTNIQRPAIKYPVALLCRVRTFLNPETLRLIIYLYFRASTMSGIYPYCILNVGVEAYSCRGVVLLRISADGMDGCSMKIKSGYRAIR